MFITICCYSYLKSV